MKMWCRLNVHMTILLASQMQNSPSISFYRARVSCSAHTSERVTGVNGKLDPNYSATRQHAPRDNSSDLVIILGKCRLKLANVIRQMEPLLGSGRGSVRFIKLLYPFGHGQPPSLYQFVNIAEQNLVQFSSSWWDVTLENILPAAQRRLRYALRRYGQSHAS